MKNLQCVAGQCTASGLRLAIVASRFNDFIVNNLISGSVDYILRNGGNTDLTTIFRVPGAFEIPVVCKKIASSGKYDGIVALGAIIRGSTPHFEYVSAEAIKGISNIALEMLVPISLGILTTESIEQAIERAGSKAGNKGAEATAAVIETISVLRQI